MKKLLIILLFLVSMLTLVSCNEKKDGIVFESKKVINDNFYGLGVEVGVYEDTGKLQRGAEEKIYNSLDRLNPKLVRCMTNFDWLVKNFSDNKTPDNLEDDTWEYDFTNKYMLNAYQILDYCETKNITVAFGIWNVIGNPNEEEDIYHMIKNVTADPRWAVMCGDLMEYLIVKKGYTCIKYFVNTNEPDYSGAKGSSKNAYNTYAIWEQGVKNVRAQFDKIGLTNLDIIGGDATTKPGIEEYLTGVATNLKNEVKNYGVHLYISNYDIDNALLKERVADTYSMIKKLDGNDSKKVIIWESGLLDGKNVQTDCNAYIANFSYGIRMADYTLQCMMSNVSGIVYWDLDDAMHFMYNEGGMTAKEWGMFSTLNEASAIKQEYRPWYHSSSLLTNLFDRGCKVISANTEIENVRMIGSIDSDGQNGGYVVVNRGKTDLTKDFRMDASINNEKLYIYIFSENQIKLDANGFVTYNYCIDGKISDYTNITVPANSVVVVSTRRL
ncbi:MAG: hypothetical protein K6F59_01115 [Gammaproteobacteria bacterium]|nr:hypothetical protein [Gammaproteobacteria bacterium]